MRSRDGAVARALAFHQCGPGSISAPCHMGLSLLLILALLRGFSSPHITQKPPSPNSYSARLDQADVVSFLNIVNNYYFLFL